MDHGMSGVGGERKSISGDWTSFFGQIRAFGPAASAYRFFDRSSLSFPAKRFSMERRLAAAMATDVVGCGTKNAPAMVGDDLAT